MSHEPDDKIDLPALSAALIVHENGSIEMHLPKAESDDAPVPKHVMQIVAIATALRFRPEDIDPLIEQFTDRHFTN